MAKVDLFVPFVIRFETGTVSKGLSNEQLFDKAKETGFANDPDDLGGATMCGVTLATYTQYCRKKGYPRPTVERLKNISYKDWLAILKTMYWDRWQADRIANQSIAEMLVDFVWASGTYGIKVPQRVLGVAVDGIVGPETLAAVADREPVKLFADLKAARIDYINDICRKRPANNKFKKGWLNRINAITFAV